MSTPYPSDQPIREDATIVTYAAASRRRRLVFEPADEGFTMLDQTLVDGDDGRFWRTVGTERVTAVRIDDPGE